MKPFSIALALVVALAWPAAAEDGPGWLERWLFNAKERTSRGIDALEAGEPTQAVDPLETALALEREDPRAQFNAGTGRLAVERPDAVPLLEAAAERALESPVPGTELAALAHYNLGNARLAGKDLEGAIEAYKQALRERPDFADAKYNLELALRQRQEQQQQDQQNQDQQDQDQDQDQEDQDQEDQDKNEQQQDQEDQQQKNQDEKEQQQEQQQQEDQQEQQQEDQQEQQQEDQQEQQQQQQNPQQRLPEFQDVPDMTAEEAAAILQSVENLEREQRQEEALEAAKTNVGRKKDW